MFQKLKIKFNKISDDFDKNVERLEKLILKYHHLEFLNKKIRNNFIIADKTNDVCRYPDNKANIDLDFENIFCQFGEKDFEEIKNDIAEFYNLFFDIGSAIINKNDEVKEISEKTREKILNLLKKTPKITIDELADELQIAFESQN